MFYSAQSRPQNRFASFFKSDLDPVDIVSENFGKVTSSYKHIGKSRVSTSHALFPVGTRTLVSYIKFRPRFDIESFPRAAPRPQRGRSWGPVPSFGRNSEPVVMGGRLLIFVNLILLSRCMDQLHIAYEWKQMDYQFPTPEIRQQARDSKEFIPENNIPMGLERYGDRLFITVPRWRSGVPASLTYVNLNDSSTTSPKLSPYPNWAAHTAGGDGKPPEIISPFRVRADSCGRLWVLDNGKMGNLESNVTKYPPAIIVYDLKTDNLLRKYVLPADQVKKDSGFANIAVEVLSCSNTYVYAADLGKPAIVVYSWAQNESWRITHHYFYPDPLACDYNVKGYNFSWTDAIFGLSISAPEDEYSTLYFHPMSSYSEFSVSTRYLRNQSIAEQNFEAFKHLGSRGPNAQSSVSFLDPKTGVLFYSLVNLNAVACWRTSNKEYSMKSQGRIYMNNITMVYPTDIKVDYNDTLWILSNRMPIWMYGKLDPNDVNFRVFSAPVLHAISHTACDITARSDIYDKFVSKVKNITSALGKPNSSQQLTVSRLILVIWACRIGQIGRHGTARLARGRHGAVRMSAKADDSGERAPPASIKDRCVECLKGPNLVRTVVVCGCIALVVQQKYKGGTGTGVGKLDPGTDPAFSHRIAESRGTIESEIRNEGVFLTYPKENLTRSVWPGRARTPTRARSGPPGPSFASTVIVLYLTVNRNIAQVCACAQPTYYILVTACVQKLMNKPITTHTHFDFNQTLLYPSVTFCREPPYKFDKMLVRMSLPTTFIFVKCALLLRATSTIFL
ncbi:Protein yellow [Eumeta japonica]|uniref:Protein yellow n=1 Tax=Eumeta variegata TaxID=151549 RepID=A0A4C1VFC3_EUMVA|nr:Protein yellow [Eumeta japonica]